MVEIKPGPELNQAVAKAIGKLHEHHEWEYTGESDSEFSVYRCSRCNDVRLSEGEPAMELGRDYCIPEFSTDLNAAFAAAEKAGMFLELTRLASGWMAGTHLLGDDYATASTPALAICAAILKLQA